MRVSLRDAWKHVVAWIDWHGRVATVAAILISVCGAAIANRIFSIWGQVTGIYLWIVTILVFAIFLCTLSLSGSKLYPMKRGQSVTVIARVHYLIPDSSGPQVLLEYDWSEKNKDSIGKPPLLSNVGNEAFRVTINTIQHGKWTAKFPTIDLIKPNSPAIAIRPTMQYDGHEVSNSNQGLILLLNPENSTAKSGEVSVSISYRDIRQRDFQTQYSIIYNKDQRELKQVFQRWGRLVEAHRPTLWNRLKGRVLNAIGREYLVR
jgi:hypothetical protein